jgi:hypothetical protein
VHAAVTSEHFRVLELAPIGERHVRVRLQVLLRRVAEPRRRLSRRQIDEARLALIGGSPRFAAEADELRERLGVAADIIT